MPKAQIKDNLVSDKTPDALIFDPLTELLRTGAQKLIAEAVEVELQLFLEQYKEKRLPDGRKQIVRNGHLPERTVQTGVGKVSIKVPRVRDRGNCPESVQFHSRLLPPYIKNTESLEQLVPWLYLRGVSTGQMNEALEALLGKKANGFSSNTVSRLKQKWERDYEEFKTREFSDEEYAYIYVDGFYPHMKVDEARHCLLVVLGVKQDGNKEFLAIEDGLRESELSWGSFISEDSRVEKNATHC
ncbi:MAG: transposase [Bacteroidota bacterium]